jgi:hypothetical protein
MIEFLDKHLEYSALEEKIESLCKWVDVIIERVTFGDKMGYKVKVL